MDTQILNLQAPYEYIHCNGEVGKHIATMIVYETTRDENGAYKLESHSHPIVKYWNSPAGVLWNHAELTDCDVLCREDRKEVDYYYFLRMLRREWGVENETDYFAKAESLRQTLVDNEIKFTDLSVQKQYQATVFVTAYNHKVSLVIEEKGGKLVCRDNGISMYPIYCEADTKDDLRDKLEDICYDWERFTDRRTEIHFETAQKKYKKLIEEIELDRVTWDL